MLKAVYCGLALGLLAAMAWAQTPAPRCRPAHLRELTLAIAEGQVTTGRASLMAEAADICPGPGRVPAGLRARAGGARRATAAKPQQRRSSTQR
jgi:hypothetical protein